MKVGQENYEHPIKLQFMMFTLCFLYGFNKQCYKVDLVIFGHSQASFFPCFLSLCSHSPGCGIIQAWVVSVFSSNSWQDVPKCQPFHLNAASRNVYWNRSNNNTQKCLWYVTLQCIYHNVPSVGKVKTLCHMLIWSSGKAVFLRFLQIKLQFNS